MLTSLAYLGLTTPKVKEWGEFASEIFGCEIADSSTDEVLRLRVDDTAWRIQVTKSETDFVDFIGWNVAAEADLDRVREAIEGAGLECHVGDEELATLRRVNQIVWFLDPWGIRHEVIFGHSVYPNSFRPGRAMGRFVTGAEGLGHVVLIVPELEAAATFFTTVLGFRLSDKIKYEETGRTVLFFNSGNRHHTLALAAGNNIVGMNHLMLQVDNIDDVGIAYDMCLQRGIPIRKSLGRHTNDRMISFYPTSPSGLHVEYGYGGLVVDEEWEPKTYHAASIWGHHMPTDKKPGLGITRPYQA